MASLAHIASLISENRPADADAALRKLVRKSSAPGVDWGQAIDLAGRLGAEDTWLQAARNWRAEAPSDPARMVAEIVALGANARHEEAARLSREIQSFSDPGLKADGMTLEAFYLVRFGRREEALALCRRALELNPDHAPAWEQIATLDGWADDPQADIAAMEALAGRVRKRESRLALHLALSRAHESAGDDARSFEHVERAAEARRNPEPFDVAMMKNYVTALQQAFSPEMVARHAVEGAGRELAFIVGIPRSGTTLLEQILSSAKDVVPTAEHAILRNAVLPLGAMTPPDLAKVEVGEWPKMSRSYVDNVRRRFGAARVYTDKSLANHFFVGAIRVLFPEARIIWIERDPRDVAWSCYRSKLMATPWTDRLDTTCRYVAAHSQLMEGWAPLFGERLHRVSYESLVLDPEPTSAGLFAFLSVERPADWDMFHQRTNPVATNSLAQVRQPLNSKGIGAWRKHEARLAPVFDATFGKA
ncbi:MAG: hypothetical protein GC152_06200 [Alphaproteobacteria bacterium]|nr:hypothetical protein [Alphaproteobacteria bacterium]